MGFFADIPTLTGVTFGIEMLRREESDEELFMDVRPVAGDEW
ncbi:MAG: hypothetical protein ACRDPC_26805 [Solirubrobacteraceae bacterium]